MKDYLRDMALFVEIAQAGTFSKASTATGVPISTLSRRLSEFEKRLGFQLIKRSTRKLELTELGAQYFAECERLVAEASAAHERLLSRSDQIEGTLKLSMTPDFGAVVLAPVLAEFARQHPLIRFDLDLTPHFVDLISNNIDVAIRFGHPVDSGITMRRIGSIHHWLCASPRYLECHGVPTDPEHLKSHAGILLKRANNPPPLMLSKGKKSVPLVTDARFHANHISMLTYLGLSHFGICLLPDVAAAPFLRSGELVRVLADWTFPTVPVLAITPSRLQPARSRLFLEFLARHAGDVLVADPPATSTR